MMRKHCSLQDENPRSLLTLSSRTQPVSGGMCKSGRTSIVTGSNLEQLIETPQVQEVASTMRSSPHDSASLVEIKWAQQKIGDEIAELNRQIVAQRDDLKAFLDQITMLTSRIDSLQSLAPVSSAASVAPFSPAPAASSVAGKRFKGAKSQGPISVGGAPLIARPKRAEP
ncbi:hypothetical protein KUL72_30020 [Bradyrhizobium arachidis]|uniref:hypothetical protein n=1 Tax=Bradyrhizobium arachidis TaxID=858423 RepID=UPI002163E345|nr:hypothetical protein [Bradyrhizobium arachidis]UVO35629.1 hypothetical protein KUL72_30020 [Bradyrhizobium arachidis]